MTAVLTICWFITTVLFFKGVQKHYEDVTTTTENMVAHAKEHDEGAMRDIHLAQAREMYNSNRRSLAIVLALALVYYGMLCVVAVKLERGLFEFMPNLVCTIAAGMLIGMCWKHIKRGGCREFSINETE